ncbi:MAG: glycosyltransferase family 4 protein [Chloroflexi bacterium]|nr:glycosyltransferase family 4 protein [Chloroflexota bacterium]
MRIAVVAPSHIPARRANTVQVMKMSQAMAALGHDVHVAAPEEEGKKAPPTWEALVEHYGLEYPFSFTWLPARPRLRRYDYGYEALRWVRKIGAELLYTRLPQAAALASITGIPTIFEVHDLPQGRMGPIALKTFLRGSGARRLVLITEALAHDLIYHLKIHLAFPFSVIEPDGVDLGRYEQLPDPPSARIHLRASDRQGEMLGLKVQSFTAGYTGHLYPGRGSEMLLQLAGRLPEITFLVVGGEPEDVQRMQAAAQQQGLSNLILTGFVPNAALPLYQAACDVLLMPYGKQVSASSGGDIARYFSPMKLFEYLAAGRPILCSDLPVLHEVLNAQNALLLPPGDTDAWASALCRIKENPHDYQPMAEQARIDARQYSWEARARRILQGIS